MGNHRHPFRISARRLHLDGRGSLSDLNAEIKRKKRWRRPMFLPNSQTNGTESVDLSRFIVISENLLDSKLLSGKSSLWKPKMVGQECEQFPQKNNAKQLGDCHFCRTFWAKRPNDSRLAQVQTPCPPSHFRWGRTGRLPPEKESLLALKTVASLFFWLPKIQKIRRIKTMKHKKLLLQA